MRRAAWRWVLAAILLVSTTDVLAQHGVADGQWRHSNGDSGATRYSDLDQINRDNVASLRVAWRWDSGNYGPTPEFKNETTPLMVDGVLHFTAGFRRDVVAIDAGTAETRWMYRLDEGERGRRRTPEELRARGVVLDGWARR